MDTPQTNEIETPRLVTNGFWQRFLPFAPLLAVLTFITIDLWPALSPKQSEKGVHANQDGAVPQVEAYLKNNLDAGAGFQAVHWSKLVSKPDLSGLPSHHVALVYKIIAADGSTRMYSKVFSLDDAGNIVFELNVEPFLNR